MSSLMHRRKGRESSGFSSIELSMSIGILAIVMAAFFGAYNGFLRDVAFAERLGDIERESRPAFNSLVIELRQATPPNSQANGQAIEFMTGERIVFYADRRPVNGPERFDYRRTNCVDGLCDLVMSIRFAEAGSAYPNFTYDLTGAADIEFTVLRRVAETARLFQGIQLAGATEVVVDDCDRLDSLALGPVPCRFDRISLTLEVAPRGVGVLPSNYVVTEEVQLRNSSF